MDRNVVRRWWFSLIPPKMLHPGFLLGYAPFVFASDTVPTKHYSYLLIAGSLVHGHRRISPHLSPRWSTASKTYWLAATVLAEEAYTHGSPIRGAEQRGLPEKMTEKGKANAHKHFANTQGVSHSHLSDSEYYPYTETLQNTFFEISTFVSLLKVARRSQ